jgi:hypothetical protein
MDAMAIVSLVIMIFQAVYPLIAAHWPQVAGGAVQVVGGASVLYKVAQYFGLKDKGGIVGKIVSAFGSIGLSK